MLAHLTAALLLALVAAACASDVPSASFPISPAQSPSNASSPPPCHLDLSAELFGGVAAACGAGGGPGSLDRGRCCPVLAAWLFAAHARTALSVPPAPSPSLANEEGLGPGDEGPTVPHDNQRCVDALGAALERRRVALPRPNATCDTVLCFCGIRLHQIGSLRCPAAFAIGGGGAAAKNATPTAAVKDLEKSCRNASYAGCSRCVQSLQKVSSFLACFCPAAVALFDSPFLLVSLLSTFPESLKYSTMPYLFLGFMVLFLVTQLDTFFNFFMF
jgi:hypothetical protein